MKFISKYRSLRIVLYPTRKIFHKDGRNDEVQVIPPIVAEFEGGTFDTSAKFELMHTIQDNAGVGERLENEEKLIHLLKGNQDYGKTFFEFVQDTPEEKVKRLHGTLEDIAKQYNIPVEDVYKQFGKTLPEEVAKSLTADDDPEGKSDAPIVIPPKEEIEAMSWNEQRTLATELEINSYGMNKDSLLAAIEEKRPVLPEGH